jgi:hypothetical protein
VHEDDGPPRDEHDVRIPGQIPPVQPIPIPHRRKHPPHHKLRPGVLPANGGHAARALFRSEDVHASRYDRPMNGQPAGAEKWLLKDVRTAFKNAGCRSLYAKRLATNDDAKKQIYLGGDLVALNLLPFATPRPSDHAGSTAQFADLNFHWMVEGGELERAPHAKLIVYPDYPEVRLSGFLLRCKRAPREALAEYAGKQYPNRLLFLGVRDDRQVIGLITATNVDLLRDIERVSGGETRGVFAVVNLGSDSSTRSALCRRLCEVHRMGWLPAQRLTRGTLVECRGQNCGGYTLEAALGIDANSASEPDFLGWEVKQASVTKLQSPRPGSVTLLTPEPSGGLYVERGVEEFIRRFGYADKRGREDRLNFGGVHKCGERHALTGLTLVCNGFDSARGVLTDLEGGVELLDADDTVAARWAFKDLLEHWKRKHAAAVFVPSEHQHGPPPSYRYGSTVFMGEGTDFLLLIKSLAKGTVYYDPGIKLEAASGTSPAIKRRSQFRSRFADLAQLYTRFQSVDVCEQAVSTS